jgi:hypothetical protein
MDLSWENDHRQSVSTDSEENVSGRSGLRRTVLRSNACMTNASHGALFPSDPNYFILCNFQTSQMASLWELKKKSWFYMKKCTDPWDNTNVYYTAHHMTLLLEVCFQRDGCYFERVLFVVIAGCEVAVRGIKHFAHFALGRTQLTFQWTAHLFS